MSEGHKAERTGFFKTMSTEHKRVQVIFTEFTAD